MILAILVYTGVISKDSWTTSDQLSVASGIQDFAICIEMLFAAIAHAYAFPPKVRQGGGWLRLLTSGVLLLLSQSSCLGGPSTSPISGAICVYFWVGAGDVNACTLMQSQACVPLVSLCWSTTPAGLHGP
jgi:hypothetical protein